MMIMIMIVTVFDVFVAEIIIIVVIVVLNECINKKIYKCVCTVYYLILLSFSSVWPQATVLIIILTSVGNLCLVNEFLLITQF